MTMHYLLMLITGAVAGGFVNGLAGFGTALMAMGVWLQIMPPQQAVAVVVILSVISGMQGMWIVRRDMAAHASRVWRFLLPGIIGVPVGLMVLDIISPTMMKLSIAGFLLLYGGFFSLRGTLPDFDRPTPIADRFVGFVGGFLGGAASLSGPVPTMWCALRPWTKGETRAVLQPFNVVVLGMTAALLAWQGHYTHETIVLVAIALPATLISAQIGIAVFGRLKDDTFRYLLIWLMFGTGILMILREMF